MTPPRPAATAREALARAVASGGGIGFAPAAPGTVASAAAAAVGAVILAHGRPWLGLAAAAATGLGAWAARATPSVRQDPGWIVIDEIAGQWLALLGLASPKPAGVLAAFALFRLLDIAKPGPVGWADRKKGPLGVMLDDAIAGAITAAMLAVGTRVV